jgi:glycosyltransferase involved in cell wall biosynthesis
VRIVHALAAASPVGGTEVYALSTAAKQAARGDDVAVLHDDSNPALGNLPALRVVDAHAADNWVAEFAPDVVHIHGFPLPAAFEEQLTRRYPIVRSLHDHAFACASGLRYLGNGEICRRAHGAACLVNVVARNCAHRPDPRPAFASYRAIGSQRLPSTRSARAVVVYSRFVRDDAIRNGISSERCRIIPYFSERAASPPPAAEARTVTFVGRLTPAKGLDVLLRALASVPDDWDTVEVIGDGWARPRYEKLARRLGLQDRVTLHGWLGVDGVGAALRRSRIVVVPSRWPEPFGIVGIEAMGHARPVVASAVGGIPEWLDDGQTGLLVPPSDVKALAGALVELLQDREQAHAFGLEAWRRAERFLPEPHLDSLDSLYHEVAA